MLACAQVSILSISLYLPEYACSVFHGVFALQEAERHTI